MQLNILKFDKKIKPFQGLQRFFVYSTVKLPNQRETFLKANIYEKEECRNCWARFYCSGGCHANAVNMNGDIMIPYHLGCEMERKRVECAIGIYSVLGTEKSE